jgi:hypothetical protein
MSDILATNKWKTNAHLIADVARLGYLNGDVLDMTYGKGTFWKQCRPEHLVTNDYYADPLSVDLHYDFRYMDGLPRNGFDTVVFDPPYKLSGTPALGQFDVRYGIDKPMTVGERLAVIRDGADEAARLTRKYVIIKCQDQVVSGKVYWQTDMLTDLMAGWGYKKLERFDFIYTPRKQRSQIHARRNTSQLLVFG